MDAVGRAILESDPPNTQRCRDLEFRFQVFGQTLEELGVEASRMASAFYGNVAWELSSMSVEENHGLDFKANGYKAAVWTRAS